MIIKNVKRLARTIFFTALFVALGIAAVVVGVNMYRDLKGNEAKKYLIEKYGFEEKNLHVSKYDEYVYEDIANCDTLWLKKCTDIEDMVAKVSFKTKDGKNIEVIAYKNETFSDDYNAVTTKAWQEKEAREAEIKKQQEEQRKEAKENNQNQK